jgi:hypothetical protein
MKICIRENADWRNVANARVEISQRELAILSRGGPDAYRLAGGEVIVVPEPEELPMVHESIEVK